MARQVDLGDDLNESIACIIYEIAQFLLCVHATVRDVVASPARITTDQRAIARSAYGCKSGILFDLHPPALIIGEMQMQSVHLHQCHPIDHAANEIRREVMTRHIQHEAPVWESRSIPDRDGRNNRCSGLHRQQLQ